jgi:hypothetical protein
MKGEEGERSDPGNVCKELGWERRVRRGRKTRGRALRDNDVSLV